MSLYPSWWDLMSLLWLKGSFNTVSGLGINQQRRDSESVGITKSSTPYSGSWPLREIILERFPDIKGKLWRVERHFLPSIPASNDTVTWKMTRYLAVWPCQCGHHPLSFPTLDLRGRRWEMLGRGMFNFLQIYLPISLLLYNVPLYYAI